MPPLVEENHFDRRYAQLADQDIPHGENLQMTVQRVAPLWQDEIAPLLGSGKNVLITGHGNSLRALVKYLEDVPEDQMDTIDIPNAHRSTTALIRTCRSSINRSSKDEYWLKEIALCFRIFHKTIINYGILLKELEE